MSTKQANSPCCQALVRHFGERRRQCIKCQRTWRIRQKKRGRKVKRSSPDFVYHYLNRDISTIRKLAGKRNIGRSSIQRRLSRSLEDYVAAYGQTWQTLIQSKGELILITDAIWYWVRGVKYTIYVLMLRPRLGTEAVILPPVLVMGHECMAGWLEAMATVPPDLKARIGAMVCDGGTGVVNLAHRHQWLLQRCQFHLLAAVQNYLTTGPRSKQLALARKVMHLVQQVINTPATKEMESILSELVLVRKITRSRGLRRILGGLALHINEYRTYLNHPRWQLPTTSNSAESCIQCIRDLMYRCRGFRTKEKLVLWLTAFAAKKKTIRCQGKNQPN